MTPVGFLETGVIYCDNNLHRLAQFPADCIDLIYLDPPFFSNRNYEVIWGDEAEVRSFEDRWQGGVRVYVEWMRERVLELHRVLKPSGSLYLHCDWHASHYLKVMLDEVFGPENFANEIVWHYNTGGASRTRFSRKHDTILFYGKREDERRGHFYAPREPFREDRTDHFTNTDSEGRKYRIRSIAGKDYRYYLDEGRIAHDVWDIDAVNAVAKERLGYPTQKPEALMVRIIEASSVKGD
ncbi:MAG TPA: site-specific DNA-methyltransferase, partial [Candidatus Dormibacteraeota bacterium]